MAKKLLYINRKKNEEEKIRKVKACAVMQRIQILSPEKEEVESLPEDAELMKMIGFGGEINSFLLALRKNGVKVDYKCIETSENKEWPLSKLYEELKAEHEEMQKLKGKDGK